jgi:hypothetical protein
MACTLKDGDEDNDDDDDDNDIQFIYSPQFEPS